MVFCLTPNTIEEIQKELKDKNISMQTLSNMTSQERTKFFSEIVGESLGIQTNIKFEENLLKKQKNSLIKWLDKQKKLDATRRNDLIKKISKMDKVIIPKNSKPFMAELAKRRLGFAVTQEDASLLLDASRIAIKKREEFIKKYPDFSNYSVKEYEEFMKGEGAIDALELGSVNLAYQATYEAIRLKYTDPTIAKAFEESTQKGIVSVAKLVPSILKSLNASIDISFARQLTKAFFYNIKAAGKAEIAGIKSISESIKGDKQLSALVALYSRPNFINGNYAHYNLDVGIQEEAFPTSVLQKIPALGSLFRASEDTFNVAIQTARANLFDYLWDLSGKSNYKMQGAGDFINSITGRGKSITDEKVAGWLNILLFSPRLLASNIEIFTNVITSMPAMTRWGKENELAGDFVKKERFYASLKFFLGEALIAYIAMALFGDKEQNEGVETDPRSSDFMKLKLGNSSFDLTGGAGAVAVLFARSITGERKSGDGKIQGNQSIGELTEQFLSGKASPMLRTAIDTNDVWGWGDGKDFIGQPMTVDKFFTNRLPISLQNAFFESEYKDEPDRLRAIVADFIGIGVSTYERENPNLYTQATPSRNITANKSWAGVTEEIKKKAESEYKKSYDKKAGDWYKANKDATENQKTENFTRIRKEIYEDIKNKYLK